MKPKRDGDTITPVTDESSIRRNVLFLSFSSSILCVVFFSLT